MRVRTPIRDVATLALGAACAGALGQTLAPVFADAAMATRIDPASITTDGPYRVGRTTYTLTLPLPMGARAIADRLCDTREVRP